jgi:tetratricopeptide (TPR) repeat protein
MTFRLPLVGFVVGLLVTLLLVGCGNAQSRKARYVQHGQEYFAAGNYDKARVEFRNAAQIDPKDGEVRFYLGQVAEKSGDLRTAVGEYRAAIDASPRLAGARASLARLLLYAGLPAKALELAEPGLAIDPKNAQLLTVRAAARQQLGDKNGALMDAQTAVQLAPDDEYAVALLASLYEQSSHSDQAVQLVQGAVQRRPASVDLRAILADLLMRAHQPQAAEEQLRQVVALQPNVLTHRYRLARFYIVQKNLDAAERTLNEAVTVAPTDPEPKLQLVEFLAAQRGHERALGEVDRLIAREPSNDALKLALGQFLVQQGASERAEALFRDVIAHAGSKPEALQARNRLAALLLLRHDVSGATAQVELALKANPRDNDALILRSNIALATGNATGAIADLRVVLRDQPNAALVWRALALAYRQNNQPDLAGDAIRNAVQLAPNDTASRFDLAQSLANQGSFDEAAPLLVQLVKDEPLNLQFQAALFRVQAAQKQYTQARATAADIQKSNPNLALGYYFTGLISEAEQNVDQAERDYEQALKVQPDSAEALVAVTRLNVRLKKPERAMARLDAVIASQPNSPLARNLKAELQASQGQSSAAIATFEAAIQVAPKWEALYHGLAMTQMAAKRSDDAIATLKRGIEQTGGSPSLVGDLGVLYQSTGRANDAIALYEGLLAKDPRSTFAANNLAMLLVDSRSDAASLKRAQELAAQLAASSAASSEGVIDTMGWVKYRSGDYRGAEALLQQAVDKARGNPEMHYHLGMAQLRAGEQESAVKNLEVALSSPGAFAGMGEARAALAQVKKSAPTG